MKSILMLLWNRRGPKTECGVRPNSEAEKAQREVEQDLAAARAKTPYYRALSHDLRTLRERNHFADNIRATVKGA